MSGYDIYDIYKVNFKEYGEKRCQYYGAIKLCRGNSPKADLDAIFTAFPELAMADYPLGYFYQHHDGEEKNPMPITKGIEMRYRSCEDFDYEWGWDEHGIEMMIESAREKAREHACTYDVYDTWTDKYIYKMDSDELREIRDEAESMTELSRWEFHYL